jgi:hypothetical protein
MFCFPIQVGSEERLSIRMILKELTLGIRAETPVGHRMEGPLPLSDFKVNWIVGTSFVETPRYEIS